MAHLALCVRFAALVILAADPREAVLQAILDRVESRQVSPGTETIHAAHVVSPDDLNVEQRFVFDAHTGDAARAVRGTTLHRVFSLQAGRWRVRAHHRDGGEL